jgi:ABC-type antimicrobial peptide transport system permease subunit
MPKKLISYTINARRREVGLRLALGAQRGRIVRRFLEQGMRVCLGGVLIGIVVALVAGRALQGILYGVSSSDIITISVVVLIVIGVAGLASIVPAVRASRFDPVQVLREE